jgi:hypothetical protein
MRRIVLRFPLGRVLRGWLVVVALSFLGIALILAWDWFFSRRLPYMRRKVSRHPPGKPEGDREARGEHADFHR